VATRSQAQTSALVDRLAALGAAVVELPVIAIEDAADGGAALAESADRLVAGDYAWVAFTSANAVSRFLAALEGRAVPVTVQWAAVGAATARRLAERGFAATLVPQEALSDALAEAFPSAGGPGAESMVLFPRAETVRGALVAGLEAKGWKVDDVVAYRTVAGHPDPASIAAAGAADAVAFTSSSTVERTVALLGVDGVPPVVVSIGPITSASARAEGLQVAAEAINSNIEGLVDAVVRALNSHPGPDRAPEPGSDSESGPPSGPA